MDSFMKRVQIVQAELKAPKNRINKFGGYKYRNTEDILQGVKPLLKKNELVLTIRDELECIGEGEKARFYVKAIATLSDTKSEESVTSSAYAREAEVKKGMDESQITGTASSYARKYALNGLFCIDDGVDMDNPDVVEILEESEADIKCDGCGKRILPYNAGKVHYTPAQVARISQMAYGKNFCLLCYKNAEAEKQMAERNKKG
jgi:hypothetical protein